ncbi:hypothetical protein IC620_05630 [Hazenella sp. IB182357]|uniref:Uncharacterized protein n=1 Tax=Polycladospora coralii TaxID=2771432 RepID=A0A926NE94_9BACL|nr:hypothetical protein [Polycladospora coralii]MBD1371838.1 hypothetical protein [Polycladospora coralii]MBS7529299.1 hypothetical protein [Polycladospora coralii]
MFKKSLLVFALMASFASTSFISTNTVSASTFAPAYIESIGYVTYSKTQYARESATPFTIYREQNQYSRLYSGYLRRQACYDRGTYLSCQYKGKIYR